MISTVCRLSLCLCVHAVAYVCVCVCASTHFMCTLNKQACINVSCQCSVVPVLCSISQHFQGPSAQPAACLTPVLPPSPSLPPSLLSALRLQGQMHQNAAHRHGCGLAKMMSTLLFHTHTHTLGWQVEEVMLETNVLPAQGHSVVCSCHTHTHTLFRLIVCIFLLGAFGR